MKRDVLCLCACVRACVRVESDIWTIVHRLFLGLLGDEAAVPPAGQLKHCTFQYLHFVLRFMLRLVISHFAASSRT